MHKKTPRTKSPGYLFCDQAGARTQDPILKRDVLYQLSYLVDLTNDNFNIVTKLGLEPRTPSLKGMCSTN